MKNSVYHEQSERSMTFTNLTSNKDMRRKLLHGNNKQIFHHMIALFIQHASSAAKANKIFNTVEVVVKQLALKDYTTIDWVGTTAAARHRRELY